MANQWFKFYGAEYLSDPKMDRLTVQERSCWLTLLCMASQSEGSIKFLSIEGLLNKSGVHFNPYDSTEWDDTKNVLQNFVQYEMIKIDKNGVISILNWEKRQEHNLTVAERVAKHRENKKCNENVTTDVTSVTTEENRIEENRIEKDTSDKSQDKTPKKPKEPKYTKEGAEILKAFENIDPKNKTYYSNKTQREACEFLIEEYGLEQVLELIPKLPESNKRSVYQITTPFEMKEKITKVFNDIKRKQSEVKKSSKYYG